MRLCVCVCVCVCVCECGVCVCVCARAGGWMARASEAYAFICVYVVSMHITYVSTYICRYELMYMYNADMYISASVYRGRRRNAQNQTSNGQLIYRSYTTHSRHILAKPDRKHQNWFDPNDQELQTLISGRDQAYQRVLQTNSSKSTTEPYKYACSLLQKRTRPLISD